MASKKKPRRAPREPKFEAVPKLAGHDAHRASLQPKKNRPSTMPQADLVAFDAGVGVLTSRLFHQSAWIDLERWPPKVKPLHASWTRSAARSRKGKWFVLSGFEGVDRWLRVYEKDLGRGKDLLLDGDGFELVYAGFLGDRAAALPGETNRDNYSSDLGYAPGLFIEENGMMIRGLEMPSGDAPKQSGFVKLGDGADLAVHKGRIGEWKGDGFAFTFKQDLKANYNAWSMCALPHGDDGFITISQRKIVHVRRGKPIATLFATRSDNAYPMLLAAGGEKSIVVSMVGGMLHRFDIAKKKMTAMDTKVFGDDWFAPVADAPCGIVAVIDQGFAIARL